MVISCNHGPDEPGRRAARFIRSNLGNQVAVKSVGAAVPCPPGECAGMGILQELRAARGELKNKGDPWF